MTDTVVIAQLNRLADLRAQADIIRFQFEELRNQILTPEIKAQLDEIATEEATALESLSSGIAELEGEIKAHVIALGSSVKAEYLHAIYSKPRITWDAKGLEGFSVAHPEINTFRKIGSSSVAIRTLER